MPEFSLVLPCYNESKSIPDILERFSQVRKFYQSDAELILVNNGSTDNTSEVLKKELSRPKYVFARSVLVEKNQGYGLGITSGLKQSRSDFLAFSHADMQCDPADVFHAFTFLKKQSKPEKTLVKGNRKGRQNFLTSSLHILASMLFLKRFDDINGQPKVFHRSLYEKMARPPKDFALDFYVQYVARKNGFDVVSMPVKFAKRRHGQSNWASTFGSRVRTSTKFVKYMLKLRLTGA